MSQTTHSLRDDLRTLTVEEAADILHVRAEAVRILIREGRLEAMRWGKRLHIRPEAIARFQEGCVVRVPDPTCRPAPDRQGRLVRRTAGPGGCGRERP